MASNDMTTLKQGTNTSPKASDASTKCTGPSVDSNPVRSAPAKSHSLGGRTA